VRDSNPACVNSRRINVLNTHPPWHTLAGLYQHFLSWSTKARYDLWEPGETDLKLAELQLGMIENEIASL
jgi:hypothetical protein